MIIGALWVPPSMSALQPFQIESTPFICQVTRGLPIPSDWASKFVLRPGVRRGPVTHLVFWSEAHGSSQSPQLQMLKYMQHLGKMAWCLLLLLAVAEGSSRRPRGELRLSESSSSSSGSGFRLRRKVHPRSSSDSYASLSETSESGNSQTRYQRIESLPIAIPSITVPSSDHPVVRRGRTRWKGNGPHSAFRSYYAYKSSQLVGSYDPQIDPVLHRPKLKKAVTYRGPTPPRRLKYTRPQVVYQIYITPDDSTTEYSDDSREATTAVSTSASRSSRSVSPKLTARSRSPRHKAKSKDHRCNKAPVKSPKRGKSTDSLLFDFTSDSTQ